jgi:SagB-type dehydrogenase family enzyme
MTPLADRRSHTTLASMRPGVRCTLGRRVRAAHLAAWPHEEYLQELRWQDVALLERLSSAECDLGSMKAATWWDEDTARLFGRLEQGGWVQTAVACGQTLLYRLVPLAAHGAPDPQVTAAKLSRFAQLRPGEGRLVLESPLATAELHVYSEKVLAVIGTLGGVPAPHTEEGAGGLAARLIADLRRTGLCTGGRQDEEAEFRYRQWQPHDLWFHARSRSGVRGRPGRNLGGTYWARSQFAPLPARPAPFTGQVIDLFKPSLPALRQADPAVTPAVEDRRSVRRHDDDHPLTLRQIGEFLYRCARVRRTTNTGGQELVDLPYPTGGAVGGLELYLVVWNTDGLSAGIYRYDAHGHRLERSAAGKAVTGKIIRGAANSAGMNELPQTVLVITARFGRVMWKYESIGYALILKQVGVLFYLMYTIATAMRLAPCALGAGNAEEFSAAVGLDYLEESSVGEFMLGSIGTCARPASDAG